MMNKKIIMLSIADQVEIEMKNMLLHISYMKGFISEEDLNDAKNKIKESFYNSNNNSERKIEHCQVDIDPANIDTVGRIIEKACDLLWFYSIDKNNIVSTLSIPYNTDAISDDDITKAVAVIKGAGFAVEIMDGRKVEINYAGPNNNLVTKISSSLSSQILELVDKTFCSISHHSCTKLLEILKGMNNVITEYNQSTVPNKIKIRCSAGIIPFTLARICDVIKTTDFSDIDSIIEKSDIFQIIFRNFKYYCGTMVNSIADAFEYEVDGVDETIVIIIINNANDIGR